MPRNQFFWACQKCHEEQFEQAPDSGPRLCGECSGDVRLRTIAVRLLIAESSPFFVLGFGTVHNQSEHMAQQAMVDDLAEKLRSGEVATPRELPMPQKGCGKPDRDRLNYEPRTTCVLTISGGSGSKRQGRKGSVIG